MQRSADAAPAGANADTRGFPSDALYFRPDIEGMRGVSVLLVLLFHLQIGMFSGGFVGVDVFYVISGFLITQIILRDLRTRQFRLIDFYLSRAYRILPAYIVMLAGAAAVAYALFLPPFIWKFDTALKASVLFVSNIVYAHQTGYFLSTHALFNPLLHTWSLSVEEQFYLCVPIILMITHRRLAPAQLYIGLLFVSLTLAIIGGLHDQSVVFLFKHRAVLGIFKRSAGFGHTAADGGRRAPLDRHIWRGLARYVPYHCRWGFPVPISVPLLGCHRGCRSHMWGGKFWRRCLVKSSRRAVFWQNFLLNLSLALADHRIRGLCKHSAAGRRT